MIHELMHSGSWEKVGQVAKDKVQLIPVAVWILASFLEINCLLMFIKVSIASTRQANDPIHMLHV